MATEQLNKNEQRLAPPDKMVDINRQWLLKNFASYRGRWVALRGGNLIAVAPSIRELKERLGSLAYTFVTKVR